MLRPAEPKEGVIGDPGARVIGGASRCGDRQLRGVAVVRSAVSRRPLAAAVALRQRQRAEAKLRLNADERAACEAERIAIKLAMKALG